MDDFEVNEDVAETPHKRSKGRRGYVVKNSPRFVFFQDDLSNEIVKKRKDLVEKHTDWYYHDPDDQSDIVVGCLIQIFRGTHAGKYERVTRTTRKTLWFKSGRCLRRNALWIRDNPTKSLIERELMRNA